MDPEPGIMLSLIAILLFIAGVVTGWMTLKAGVCRRIPQCRVAAEQETIAGRGRFAHRRVGRQPVGVGGDVRMCERRPKPWRVRCFGECAIGRNAQTFFFNSPFDAAQLGRS